MADPITIELHAGELGPVRIDLEASSDGAHWLRLQHVIVPIDGPVAGLVRFRLCFVGTRKKED